VFKDDQQTPGFDACAPAAADAAAVGRAQRYQPPRITALGTLADLTAGGTNPTEDDGFGGAGASGTI
jgi:hypothetical protein